ncbi:MAG: septum formation initiator family protein [Candidatus Omnitrophota bacterium]|nr:MAG: septum formation initiator family protein [Candidatus Omnitrophota bacterium]
MAKKRIIYIAITGIFIIATVFLPGFSKLQKLREKNRNLKRRIEILTRANEELNKEKEKLENDPSYIEKVAREKLGMTRKDEIVLK